MVVDETMVKEFPALEERKIKPESPTATTVFELEKVTALMFFVVPEIILFHCAFKHKE